MSFRGSSSRKWTSRGRLCAESSSAPWATRAAPAGVVGLPVPRPLRHRRVLEQRALDLAGADPEATALDEVGGPSPDDPDVAVGRTRGEVAGAEPAVLHRGGGG